ncbi:MAG TPA: hypothetical protein VGD84_10325, partial [Pseudonocardiaceae bacterium]
MRTVPPLSGGFGFPAGAAAGVLVTIAVIVAGGTQHVAWSAGAYAVAVAAVAAVTTLPAALGTAMVCWFLLAGFVIGRRGDVPITAATGWDLLILALV